MIFLLIKSKFFSKKSRSEKKFFLFNLKWGMVTEIFLNCCAVNISPLKLKNYKEKSFVNDNKKGSYIFNVRMRDLKMLLIFWLNKNIFSYHCIPHTVYLTDTKLLTDQDYRFIARILKITNLVTKKPILEFLLFFFFEKNVLLQNHLKSVKCVFLLTIFFRKISKLQHYWYDFVALSG